MKIEQTLSNLKEVSMSDRHTFRAYWHDYNRGIYFVTICTHQKQHVFGDISNGHINYSIIGKIVLKCLHSIPKHNKDVELWNYIIMPNHIHMVLAVGTQYFAPLPAVWQRNYHEHIIRNQKAYENIMSYIDNNVATWNDDCFNMIN